MSIGGGGYQNSVTEVKDLIDDTNNGGNTPNINNNSTNVNVNNNANNGTTNVGVNKITPQTFKFNSDEISIAKGSGEINFSYTPDNNMCATSIAYQYRFNNSMKVDMAVNLKSISTTSVTLSYAYSDTELTNVTSSNTVFECQRISPNATKYIYIVVTPTSTSIPSTFSSSVVFYQGEAGTLDIICEGETLSIQTIVKGQEVSEPIIDIDNEGLFLDEACTISANLPLRMQRGCIYVKISPLQKRAKTLYSLNGTTDSEGYTLYGAYPQDYVGSTLNTTLKNALSAGTLTATDWTYTTDINGTTTTLAEYEYEGNYYAYLSSSQAYDTSYTFNTDTSTTIGTGNAYFFKVEPLRWTNHNGTYLCEYSVGSRMFDGSTIKWEESAIRTYLNEVFYIESGISLVKKDKTTIQNNTSGGTPTEDYIWLPSYDEMRTWYTDTTSMRKGCSDLAKATYTYWYIGYSTSYYWTRSAGEAVYSVNPVGGIDGEPDLFDIYYGVCPAFAL